MKKQTYEKLAYDVIRTKILNGEFYTGKHISEVSVATELGISRTPVRRALVLLEAENLIEIRVNKGAVVIESLLTAERFIEMIDLIEMTILRAIDKMEYKNIDLNMDYLNGIISEMKRSLMKGNQILFIQLLFKCLKMILLCLQNQYILEWIKKIEYDFHFKAKREIKIIPFLLAEETITALELFQQNLQKKDFQILRNQVKSLVNQYIIHTFR